MLLAGGNTGDDADRASSVGDTYEKLRKCLNIVINFPHYFLLPYPALFSFPPAIPLVRSC